MYLLVTSMAMWKKTRQIGIVTLETSIQIIHFSQLNQKGGRWTILLKFNYFIHIIRRILSALWLLMAQGWRCQGISRYGVDWNWIDCGIYDARNKTEPLVLNSSVSFKANANYHIFGCHTCIYSPMSLCCVFDYFNLFLFILYIYSSLN